MQGFHQGCSLAISGAMNQWWPYRAGFLFPDVWSFATCFLKTEENRTSPKSKAQQASASGISNKSSQFFKRNFPCPETEDMEDLTQKGWTYPRQGSSSPLSLWTSSHLQAADWSLGSTWRHWIAGPSGYGWSVMSVMCWLRMINKGWVLSKRQLLLFLVLKQLLTVSGPLSGRTWGSSVGIARVFWIIRVIQSWRMGAWRTSLFWSPCP